MITYKQLSVADIFSNCQELYDYDKPQFLRLLEEHINLDELVPSTFRHNFYAHTGRPRKYPLNAMLWALILQRLLSIPTDALLIVFLHYSRHMREFCGFDKVPDASKFTRFKQDFLGDLQTFFDHLVDVTEPICQEIDSDKASMCIFDTTGIEAWVQENNPKYANSLIRSMKAWAKSKGLGDSFDPYKAAYGSMPTCAEANSEVKQQYINGHFCYAYKAGVVTNGLGVIRSLEFYDEEYHSAHPDIEREKKSDSPEEDKSVGDTRLLIPTLQDFFHKHPGIQPVTFLGDAAFDSTDIYKALLSGDTFGTTPDGEGCHFLKAYIPLNSAHGSTKPDCPLNADGIPCCPNDPSLAMKREGNTSHLRCGIPTMKFVCPKMKWEKGDDGKYHRTTHCENPCTDSKSGRMFYIYPEKNLRTYPGTLRGTDEWDSTYKIRTTVERSINQIKDSFCLGNRKTRNQRTLHADLLLAGITQLFTVVLANKIHQSQFIRSIKPLIA